MNTQGAQETALEAVPVIPWLWRGPSHILWEFMTCISLESYWHSFVNLQTLSDSIFNNKI